MSNDSGNVLLAVITGAILGVGAGILYAPAKGEKTRKKIKKNALKTKDDISHRISQATEELTKTAEEKKVDFELKLEDTISNMSYKADDIIMSLENKLAELKKKNAQLQK
ncbi:YtxH domain-containing protein [Zobellia laminariae]|uniref:YtxH domain-containing protein n=1 Tax=Zobellia laminariae TaxID=248906 RepID=UPI0012D9ACBC|nr:YtxH domain-containing protein [Zobellia laminariae]MUH39546.1 YtxH domain-containing protein [Zobellia laminariae]WKX77957.1 YtxH domain-containing protein [Zobellia laminariae]